MEAVERRHVEDAISVEKTRLQGAHRALEMFDVDRNGSTKRASLAARALPPSAAEVADQQNSKWLGLGSTNSRTFGAERRFVVQIVLHELSRLPGGCAEQSRAITDGRQPSDLPRWPLLDAATSRRALPYHRRMRRRIRERACRDLA